MQQKMDCTLIASKEKKPIQNNEIWHCIYVLIERNKNEDAVVKFCDEIFSYWKKMNSKHVPN